MTNHFYPFVVLSIATLAISCEKESADPPYSEVPAIQLVEVSRMEILEFFDTLEIVISYQDGNGDLGNVDPDIPSLIVKDARLEKADSFHLQPLAPPGAQVPLEGELRLRLPHLFLLGNGTSETTRFRIKLLDRSGNESNEVQTPNIIIKR